MVSGVELVSGETVLCVLAGEADPAKPDWGFLLVNNDCEEVLEVEALRAGVLLLPLDFVFPFTAFGLFVDIRGFLFVFVPVFVFDIAAFFEGFEFFVGDNFDNPVFVEGAIFLVPGFFGAATLIFGEVFFEYFFAVFFTDFFESLFLLVLAFFLDCAIINA